MGCCLLPSLPSGINLLRTTRNALDLLWKAAFGFQEAVPPRREELPEAFQEGEWKNSYRVMSRHSISAWSDFNSTSWWTSLLAQPLCLIPFYLFILIVKWSYTLETNTQKNHIPNYHFRWKGRGFIFLMNWCNCSIHLL